MLIGPGIISVSARITATFLPGTTSFSFLILPAALETILLVRTMMSFSSRPPIFILDALDDDFS